jgi:hypothetical protein
LTKKDEIAILFKLEYARFYQGNRVWKRNSIAQDSLIWKALEVLDDAALYNAYLN